MTDLYAILGVERGAPNEELHAAFRNLAKVYHPDAPGGDEAHFRTIAEAYAILRDPERRAAYDSDGTIDGKADNAHMAALNIVRMEVEGLWSAMTNQGDAGVLHSDAIELITNMLDAKISNIEQIIERIKRDIVRLSDFAERFSAKDGKPSVMRQMLEAKLRMLEETTPKAEADLTAYRDARAIVQSHEFQRKEMPPGMTMDTNFG